MSNQQSEQLTLAQRLRAAADVRVFSPITFKDARAVMREGADAIAEMRRLLHFAITHSGAKHLFSESFIEDVEAALKVAKGDQARG